MAQYPAEMDKTIQQIQHREREMLDHFEFIEPCFLGDRQTFKGAEHNFLEWQTSPNEVIALKQSG